MTLYGQTVQTVLNTALSLNSTETVSS